MPERRLAKLNAWEIDRRKNPTGKQFIGESNAGSRKGENLLEERKRVTGCPWVETKTWGIE